MGIETGISWATSTFNPLMGCQEVSPACDHCYARTLVTGRMALPVWGKDAGRHVTSNSYWKQPLQWQRKAERLGDPWRVFCGSLCDVMEDHADWIPVRSRLYDLIERTPALTWLLLTKRPQNFTKFLPKSWVRSKFPANVWCLTTVESPEYLWRIDYLKSVPCVVHGLSIEPLLADIPTIGEHLDGIGWCLVGGESGGGARPMHPDWPRRIRDECVSRMIPFHFKQWGDWLPIATPRMTATIGSTLLIDTIGRTQPASWSDVMESRGDLWAVERVGKKTAGHLLDGKEWLQFPEVRG